MHNPEFCIASCSGVVPGAGHIHNYILFLHFFVVILYFYVRMNCVIVMRKTLVIKYVPIMLENLVKVFFLC